MLEKNEGRKRERRKENLDSSEESTRLSSEHYLCAPVPIIFHKHLGYT